MTARSTAQGHAATIRDEVSAGANTATRVGTNLRELADNVVFGEDAGTTDNRLLRSDGVSGAIQNSPITCDDSGNLTGLGTVSGRNVATDGTKLDLYPTVSGLTTGQCIRATGAATMAFGALDLANTNAVTGVLPITNVAAETPARIITALSTAASSIGVNSQKITNLAAASANGDAIRYEQFTDTFWCWSAVSASATTATRYLHNAFSGNAQSATEGDSYVIAAHSFTVTSIYAYHDIANVDTVTYTLRINGVDTAVTVTMASSGTAASATGFSVAVSAGDRLSLKAVQSSTTAGAAMRPRVSIGRKI